MKPDYFQRLEAAFACVFAPVPPMTADERATFNSQRAAEMARAEARRAPSPQLDFGESA